LLHSYVVVTKFFIYHYKNSNSQIITDLLC